MQIILEGGYAGEMLNIRLVGGAAALVSVQIKGYIESPTVRIQHLKSPFRAVTGGCITARLPASLPPSYSSTHYKIWYECCAMAEDAADTSKHRAIFTVHSNNLLDFNSEVVTLLNFNTDDYAELRDAKAEIAGLLLRSLLSAPGSAVGTNSRDQAPSTAIPSSGELMQQMDEIQARVSPPPTDGAPCILEVQREPLSFTINAAEGTIARLSYPSIFRQNSTITLAYLRDTASTEVAVYRAVYERGSLVDMAIVFRKSFRSGGCLERVIDINIDNFSIKTYLFEVRYTLAVVLDNSEVDIDLMVVSDGTKIVYTDD
ncbi:hypothetical protein PAPHI01_1560 [Pancytospora philotis]|nr:hypothetical protein PAPHI01_1543 [Pancytospora philotis]KAI4292286.1 hypothetical protein PAPHI01_1560 [Pancytospora philotis]